MMGNRIAAGSTGILNERYKPVHRQEADAKLVPYVLDTGKDHHGLGSNCASVELYCMGDQHGQQKYVAIKFISIWDVTRNVEREIMNHWDLVHPNIVEFIEVFTTDERLALVLEFVKDGSIINFLCRPVFNNGLPERVARPLFQQIMRAVDYCHQKGVPHRDIKLENVLLDLSAVAVVGKNGDTELDLRDPGKIKVKLCDMGWSKNVSIQGQPETYAGSPAYIAPEVVNCRQQRQEYCGQKSDIWSCGVLLYMMLVANFPFGHPEQEDAMFKRIQAGQYTQPSGLSGQCLDLIARILTVDVNQRISMQQIFNHPWFTDGGLPEGWPNHPDIQGIQIHRQQTRSDANRIVRSIIFDNERKRHSSLFAAGRESSGSSELCVNLN